MSKLNYIFNVSMVVFAVALMPHFLPASLDAQDIPAVTEKQKSVILFDIRYERMLSEAGKIGIVPKDFENAEMPPPFSAVKTTDIARVFGSASLPQDLAIAMRGMAQRGGELPFEFFVRVQFKDADALEKFETEFKRNSETTKIGGREFYSAGRNAPANVVAHRVDETSFEIGTAVYCQQAKRTFFTDRLSAAYKSAPNHPVRIAVDLETPAPFLAELVAMGKQQIDNPVAGAYFDLIDNASSLVITQSLASENLLTLIAQGKDESDAEELAGGIDSLLGTAKLAAGPMMMQFEQDSPELKDSLAFLPRMIESLAAKREGKTVKLIVPKPEGFDESISKLQAVTAAKAKENQRLNNFRQVGLSTLNYESAFQRFPFSNIKARHADISWRASVLPFLEESELHDQLDLAKSPSEEPNSGFAEKMPVSFGAGGKLSNCSWIQSKVERFRDITDGSSNTIMLIENPTGKPWLENNPLTVDQAVKLVTELPDGAKLAVTFYDCSTRYITNKVSEEDLRSLFTPDDGRAVENMDW